MIIWCDRALYISDRNQLKSKTKTIVYRIDDSGCLDWKWGHDPAEVRANVLTQVKQNALFARSTTADTETNSTCTGRGEGGPFGYMRTRSLHRARNCTPRAMNNVIYHHCVQMYKGTSSAILYRYTPCEKKTASSIPRGVYGPSIVLQQNVQILDGFEMFRWNSAVPFRQHTISLYLLFSDNTNGKHIELCGPTVGGGVGTTTV